MDVSFLLGPDAPDGAPAVVWHDRPLPHGWLREAVAAWGPRLDALGIAPGTVVSVESDHGPETYALLLALIARDAIAAPLPRDAEATGALGSHLERRIVLDPDERWRTPALTAPPPGAAGPPGPDPHPLIARLRAGRRPGWVLRTSGSSGRPKHVVHDLGALLERFRRPRRPLRMVALLAFDHLGGLSTMLHALASGGTLVVVPDRRPDTVCAAVARHRPQVLPASPTFLRLMLLAGAHERFDLGSLRQVTYGAEPMSAATLRRLRAALPDVTLKQTYGLIEVGIVASRSRDDDSLWLALDIPHRVVDGMLELRTPSAMLGYLDAPSPFTADGFLVTGDRVERDGGELRILGRASELINVGGEKVWPQEVEAVVEEVEGIADVEVYGEPHALVGSVVCARIRPVEGTEPSTLVRNVRRHCHARLARHQVPVRIRVTDEEPRQWRGKRMRGPQGAGPWPG